MAYTVIVHIANQEAFLAEMENLPDPKDISVHFRNPRKRDGKPIAQYDHEAEQFFYPWEHINYIEVLADRGSREELVEFFRED